MTTMLAHLRESRKARLARINAAGARHADKLAELQAARDLAEQIKLFEIALAGMPKKKEPPPVPAPTVVMPAVEAKLSILKIQSIVAAHFGLSRHDLTGPKRQQKYIHPRQIACFLAKELTPFSFPQIGRKFGDRDHTTVLHSVSAVRRRVESDPKWASMVNDLRSEISA